MEKKGREMEWTWRKRSKKEGEMLGVGRERKCREYRERMEIGSRMEGEEEELEGYMKKRRR